MPKMQKKNKKKKTKNNTKQTGKENINRERAREYQVHFFSFFILILIQHFGGKNLQKIDKKKH